MYLNNSLYYRFIDDILYTDKNNFLPNKYTEIFPDLVLNTITDKEVQFLDLLVSFDHNYRLKFNLFIKPTFTGSYLSTNSNHPKFIYRGIIISLISRIRRICSEINDFYFHCISLLNHLLKRGYSFKLITGIIRSFAKMYRNTLLDYKIKERNDKNSIYFVSYFNFNLSYDLKFLNNTWKYCIPDSFLNNFKLKILYKNTPNIGSYFINNFSVPFYDNFYTKCPNISCQICKYSITDRSLFNNKFISLHSSTSCNDRNIIYFIFCTKCKLTYIGESKRSVKERLSEHLSRVRYFIKIKTNNNSTIIYDTNDSFHLYNHFSKDHNIHVDFKFRVYIKNIINYRLRMESDLIHIFNTQFPYGLNKKTNSYDSYFHPYKPP